MPASRWRTRRISARIGAARPTWVALCAAALTFAPVNGQSLQRVSVASFKLTTDAQAPRVGVPFHLIVTLRLRDSVSDVRNLQLPLLAELELLGDTRSVTSGARGTLYREIITVAGLRPGAVTIPPATFDAIDVRDGKAKEYATNAVVLRIAGSPLPSHLGMFLAWVLVSLGVAAIVLGAAIVALTYKPKRTASLPAPAPEPAAAPASVAQALALLEHQPGRIGALRAREVLWRMVDARDDETLADVMDRARDRHPGLLDVLPALERATFTYDDDVSAAVADALGALRRAAR